MTAYIMAPARAYLSKNDSILFEILVSKSVWKFEVINTLD